MKITCNSSCVSKAWFVTMEVEWQSGRIKVHPDVCDIPDIILNLESTAAYLQEIHRSQVEKTTDELKKRLEALSVVAL